MFTIVDFDTKFNNPPGPWAMNHSNVYPAAISGLEDMLSQKLVHKLATVLVKHSALKLKPS